MTRSPRSHRDSDNVTSKTNTPTHIVYACKWTSFYTCIQTPCQVLIHGSGPVEKYSPMDEEVDNSDSRIQILILYSVIQGKVPKRKIEPNAQYGMLVIYLYWYLDLFCWVNTFVDTWTTRAFSNTTPKL